MSTNACPCCGRAYPKAKANRIASLAQFVNTADMSEKELFAHYKRTAPVEDVLFQLRLQSLPYAIRSAYMALLETLRNNGGKATPDTKREYLRLQQVQRELRERAPRLRLARRLGRAA
jgi:hypothetical protein